MYNAGYEKRMLAYNQRVAREYEARKVMAKNFEKKDSELFEKAIKVAKPLGIKQRESLYTNVKYKNTPLTVSIWVERGPIYSQLFLALYDRSGREVFTNKFNIWSTMDMKQFYHNMNLTRQYFMERSGEKTRRH